MSDTDMLFMGAIVKENEQLRQLLRECQPVLRAAFFANFRDQRKADELYDRIAKVVGREQP